MLDMLDMLEGRLLLDDGVLVGDGRSVGLIMDCII